MWADCKPKKSPFWSIIFSYSSQQQTISQLDYDVQWKMDFIWQPAQWLDQEAPKHFPKPHLHPKKRKSWSPFGGLLPVWPTTVNPAETITSRSMLSKSMRYMENWNTCSWHWSTERAWFFSVTRPGHTSQNQRCKSWTNWATKFCLICHIYLTSHQLSTISSRLLTTFW